MKRIVLILASLVTLASLAACGGVPLVPII